jgi:hypothetical protein
VALKVTIIQGVKMAGQPDSPGRHAASTLGKPRNGRGAANSEIENFSLSEVEGNSGSSRASRDAGVAPAAGTKPGISSLLDT